MPRLTPPQKAPVIGRAQISPGVVTGAGQTIAGAGRELAQLGAEYAARSKASSQSLDLTQNMTRATEEFAVEARNRLQQVTDENGKPTFSTMSQDIQDIGNKIKSKYLLQSLDFDVARKFDQEFSGLVSNKVLSSQSVARQQQQDFTRASLNESLQNWTRQAVQLNPDEVGEYEIMADRRIKEQVSSGMISATEGQRLSRTFSGTVREESLRNLIHENPARAARELGRPLESLGLDLRQKNRLDKELEGKFNDVQRQEQILIKKQEEQISKQIELNILKAQVGIKEGSIGLAELEELKENLGRTEQDQEINYLKLRKSLSSQLKAEIKRAEKNAEVLDAISRGDRLTTGQFKTKDIDEAYLAQVDSLRDPETNELPPIEARLVLASNIKGPVPTVQQEITAIALDSKDPEVIGGALQGFTHLHTRRPEVLQGMDKQARQVMSYAASLTMNSSIPPEDAVQRARKAVLEADQPIMQARTEQLKQLDNKGEPFSREELMDFILNEFDEKGALDFLPFIGDEPTIAEDVITRIKSVVEDAYRNTGSVEAAKMDTVQSIKRDFGVTQLNGGEHLMFAPPEQFYPDISIEDMQSNLKEFMMNNLIKHVDQDDIIVKSDALTRGTFDRHGREIISYTIEYVDEEGVPRVVLDPETRTPARWVPEPGGTMRQQMREREIKNINERKKREQEGDKSVLDRLQESFKGLRLF